MGKVCKKTCVHFYFGEMSTISVIVLGSYPASPRLFTDVKLKVCFLTWLFVFVVTWTINNDVAKTPNFADDNHPVLTSPNLAVLTVHVLHRKNSFSSVARLFQGKNVPA